MDMIFPSGSQNVRADFTGNVTDQILLATSTDLTDFTVLYESFNTGSVTLNAKLRIKCGATTLLNVNNFRDVPEVERFKYAYCTDPITVTIAGTTGSPTSTVSVVYYPNEILADNQANDISFLVIIGLVLMAISLIDFIRRLFMFNR